MPIRPTIRPLQFAARNPFRAPRLGLWRRGSYFPRRQISQLDHQTRDPSPVSGTSIDNEVLPSSSVVRKYNLPGRRVKSGYHSYFWNTSIDDPSSPIEYYETFSSNPLVTNRTWLRDACTCDRCVDSSSGQKRFASTDIPPKIGISKIDVTESGDLRVCWKDDFLYRETHVSVYPPTLWRHHTHHPVRPLPVLWTRDSLAAASPYFDYESFMANGPEYRQALQMLNKYGLVFLCGVPSSEETVKRIASKIGIIQDTFYGTTWDVISKPDAENVAYTNSFLGLHQDLLYMQNVPRIQILHCRKNTCEGGESLFSDGYRAAHELRCRFPKMVKPLLERYVTYHYNKGGHSYQRSHSVLSRGMGMYWSPVFQKPIQPDNMTKEGMRRYMLWHDGASHLKNILELETSVYEYKMRSGDCAIFDNRRLFHGRREFNTSSGERWLKGTYVESDSYESLMNALQLGSTHVMDS
ncbi:Clavaminate synthase-like protein [Xylaria venustula]|nr:Clavaminate synthase-like protein [Xylaria venustula]